MFEFERRQIIGESIVGGILEICLGYNLVGMTKSRVVLPGMEYTLIFVAAMFVGGWNGVGKAGLFGL